MAITGLLNQTVSIENEGSVVGKHGETSFGAATSYQARFQRTNKTIMNSKGELEPISGIVFLPADATVSIGAKLTYGSDIYRVITLETVPGANGVTHHLEAMVQSWSFGS
jgi:hypothetical protein